MSRLGPNEALVGAPSYERDLATPALMLDLDAFEANLRVMSETVSRHGRKLRPHVKAHKSTAIARRQIEAGAIGLCCATVREAETMAAAGLEGLLLTTPITTPNTARRLVAARERVNELLIVVDSHAGVEVLANLAAPERPIGVLAEIDMGQTRTGVTSPEAAVQLARAAAGRTNLRFRGVQAYYGHLQHVPTRAECIKKTGERWTVLEAHVDALNAGPT